MITTVIKPFEYMTLKEITHLKNKYLVQKYNEELKKMKINKITKDIVDSLYGEPLSEILDAVEQSKLEFMSESLFPGSSIVVYPGIKEVRAKENYTCDFSGAKISKGSIYVNYRPMLKNIDNKTVYVLKKTIKVETSYEHNLPTNITELEDFNNRILNYRYQDNDDIQYDYLFNQTGGLHFKKLSRRKKYENRDNK